MSSILRTSKFVRYFVGIARNIVVSHRQEVDGNLLHRSQNLAGVFSSNFFSGSNLNAGSSLENTVRRLDEDARRTGRISMKEVEEALNQLRHSKRATTSQSLMVIRCCGNLVPEETPEQRTKLVEEIWNTLEKLGVSLDISHYNALLKVYLENEHKFSPTEFLAKLEKQGVEPNRVTYQRLVAGYCQIGDIAGATKILEYMKEKQLPVSEGVFNALILGHSQADDMESAEGMLGVMKQANLEPSNETYTALLCGYARRGDKEAIDRLITDCKVKDVLLADRDFLEMVYVAAINGHNELVEEIVKNIRTMVGYNQDAANVILRLITKGMDEAAYKVFLTMSQPMKTGSALNMSGHVLIKQLVKTNRPVEQIVSLCEKLEKDGHTEHGLYIAIEYSFHHGNVELTLNLLRAFKDKNGPARQHYFWPSLVTLGKAGDIQGLVNVLKMMNNEFNVPPNPDTLKNYYLPYVESLTADQKMKQLLEVGVSRRSTVLALVQHLVGQNKLKEAIDIASQYRGVNLRSVVLNRMLVDALQQTGDVKSAVALVHVMVSNTPAAAAAEAEEDEEPSAVEDFPGRFLSSTVYYSQSRAMVAEILKEMLAQGLGISTACAETVENRLQGNELTTEVSDLLAKLSAGDLSPVALKRTSSGFASSGPAPISRNPGALERIKERMIANKEGQEKVLSITRSIFFAYCFQEDLENALRVKQEWEEELKQEVTNGWWASLLDLYCTKEDIEAAKMCLENIKKTSSEVDGAKILKLIKLYVKNNNIDEALQIIKEIKPREEANYMAKALSWQTLTTAADSTKDPEQVKKVLNTLVEQNYIEHTNIFLGPVIKAYLLKDDLEGALREFEHCVKMYRATPWKNELATRFIEKEDAVNLQTLVDLSTQVHGEINSLYDLVLSFVECGRIRQARKILETPGLSSRNSRIHNACERYKNEGLAAPLEGLVEVTKDLPHIDRSEIYYNLLETYCQADNVEKALGLWTQMQDEDVNVSEEFLVKLGNFLKSKGLEVPFAVPEYRAKTTESVKKNEESQKPYDLSMATRQKNVGAALKIIQKSLAEKSQSQFTRGQISRVVELLIENNNFKEATELVVALSPDLLPTMRTLRFFINKLSQTSNLGLLNQLGQHLPEDTKRLISFNNRYFNGVVAAGRAKEELDKMEKEIDEAKTQDELDNLAEIFPRGGIMAVLESSPSCHEQVIKIVQKYHDKGVSDPAICLSMYYLADRQPEKAKELFEQYNLANSSRLGFKSVLKKARTEQDPKLIEDLISLLIDAPSITPQVKGLIYSNLINIHNATGNYEEGQAKLEEALKVTPLENIYHNTLMKLKEGLEANNIPFKYTILPQKKAKESSSSSSSDEAPKQSVAAKH